MDALERGVEACEDKWDRNIQIMAKRASRYKGQERDAREATPDYVKKVARKKRTKFMGDLLKERKYPDHDVARCLREGFPLTGDMPTTGVFKKKPELDIDVGADPEWLAHMAPELREELIECVRSG